MRWDVNYRKDVDGWGEGMDVAIVGAGALGMLFGGYTHLCGYNVRFVVRRKKQAEAIESMGISLRLLTGKTHHFYPQVHLFGEPTFSSPAFLIIVAVKQPDLVPLLDWLSKSIRKDTALVFLMNGLGHPEKIKSYLPDHEVIYAVTQNGATRLSDTETVERGKGPTKLGTIPGKRKFSEGVQKWMEAMNAHLPLEVSPEIEAEMWKKGMVNACINPLTALFQVPNGELVRNKSLYWMMEQIFAELMPLTHEIWGKEHPLFVQEESIWQEIVGVCEKTAGNHSSMLQDIRFKRKTEIEALNGYFVRKASQLGHELKLNRFIRAAILALEEIQDNEG